MTGDHTTSPDPYLGCAIPPEIYAIGFGWDPEPEINRLRFLSREAGIEPQSALELGSGTGRLLAGMNASGIEVIGLEISPDMADFASRRAGVPVVVGDMSDFNLQRRFDLIYTSANTIRHITADAAIASMWRCIAAHLSPGGVFIADLELGRAYEAEKLGKPERWMISRDEKLVHVTWTVVRAPDASNATHIESPGVTDEPRSDASHASSTTRIELPGAANTTRVEWCFELRAGGDRREWREQFDLRAYDAWDFIARANRAAGLSLVGIHEIRDPYLIETPIARAAGRHLVTLRT